jgi:hypothetical protein
MAGILDMSILLPLWVPLIMAIIIIGLAAFVFRSWDFNRKYCPERSIIIAARRGGIPVIELTDIGSGNTVWELGTKQGNDIKFDTKYSGIRIDPVLTSVGCEPKRFGGGLDVYGYAYENWLPQTTRNHLAFKAIAEYFHSKAKDLEFLTDMEFIALLSTPETHLAHDINVYISKYFKNVQYEEGNKKYTKMVRQFKELDLRDTLTDDREFIEVEDNASETGYSVIKNPQYGAKLPNPTFGREVTKEQDVTPREIVNRIEEIKRDISTLPICFGWYCGTEAFKNNAYGYSAQDLEMLLVIHDKLMLADLMKKINLMTYAFAFVLVVIGGSIGIYILSLVAGKH